MKEEFTTNIDPSVLFQQAERTIQNPIDAIIELMTNSDDADSKEIKITIWRKKGFCEKIKVCDNGSGMPEKVLRNALGLYGKIRLKINRKRRGMFNRGLKEAIIVFRKGGIVTYSGRDQGWIVESHADEENLKLNHKIKPLNSQEKYNLFGKTGTCVELIKERNDAPEKFKIEDTPKLKEILSKHWALRNIVMRKKVSLKVINLSSHSTRGSPLTTTIPLYYSLPKSKERLSFSGKLPKYKDKFCLKVWESEEKLAEKFSPTSDAGILIRTQGVNVGFHDFGLEARPGFYYFHSVLDCPGIYERERKAKGRAGIVDLDRGGLNWRKSLYLKALEKHIRDLVLPLIKEKEQQITKSLSTSSEAQKTNQEIAYYLSRLLAPELKEEGPGVGPLNGLVIAPAYFYVPPGEKRVVGIYAPSSLVKKFGHKVKTVSENSQILVKPEIVELKRNPKSNNYIGKIKVKGYVQGDFGIIRAVLGNEQAEARVEIRPFGKRPSSLVEPRKKGGIFSDVKYEKDPNSIFRARLADGVIWINLDFPGTQAFLTLDGPQNHAGVTYLAEVIAETAFRHVATERLANHLVPSFSQNEIETFKNEISRLQERYLSKIHGYIARKYKKI